MSERTFEPGAVQYNGSITSMYPMARALSAETADTWSTILKPFLTTSPHITVLDLGCGTGRFAPLLADRFNGTVIGLDASIAMLQTAMQHSGAGNLFYAAASGECLPLADLSCDVAWLSQVIHHIRDHGACARELHRVVRRDGWVLMRGTFGDRLDGFPTLFHFFPEARQITAQFPTLTQVITVFQSAGFSVQSLQRVRQKICESLAEFARRTRLRADSTLVLLPDAEFERCQTALEEAAGGEHVPSPVIETVELVVFRASPSAGPAS